MTSLSTLGQSEQEFALLAIKRVRVALSGHSRPLSPPLRWTSSEHVEAKTRESYVAWADCIKPLHVADIPVQMYEKLDSFEDASLAKLLIPEPCLLQSL